MAVYYLIGPERVVMVFSSFAKTTKGSHEKSPLPRLEKPADLGNPSPGLTFSW